MLYRCASKKQTYLLIYNIYYFEVGKQACLKGTYTRVATQVLHILTKSSYRYGYYLNY